MRMMQRGRGCKVVFLKPCPELPGHFDAIRYRTGHANLAQYKAFMAQPELISELSPQTSLLPSRSAFVTRKVRQISRETCQIRKIGFGIVGKNFGMDC
jgi:hypothetical protein